MAALPSDLTPIITGHNKNYKARALISNFGDGYRQRAGDGINTIEREIEVKFIGSYTNIAIYVTFFKARDGYEAFTWTPPDEASSLKWTCQEWNVTGEEPGTSSLTATFRKEFDLV